MKLKAGRKVKFYKDPLHERGCQGTGILVQRFNEGICYPNCPPVQRSGKPPGSEMMEQWIVTVKRSSIYTPGHTVVKWIRKGQERPLTRWILLGMLIILLVLLVLWAVNVIKLGDFNPFTPLMAGYPLGAAKDPNAPYNRPEAWWQIIDFDLDAYERAVISLWWSLDQENLPRQITLDTTEEEDEILSCHVREGEPLPSKLHDRILEEIDRRISTY